jgi:hypothetical protein
MSNRFDTKGKVFNFSGKGLVLDTQTNTEVESEFRFQGEVLEVGKKFVVELVPSESGTTWELVVFDKN